MATQSISSRKAAPTTPLTTGLEITLTYKFLLSRVQTFMALAIMLACKGFATNGTNKRSLIRVCAEMGAQIVRTGKALGAQRALEGSWVFLYALRGASLLALVFGVGQAQSNNVVGNS